MLLHSHQPTCLKLIWITYVITSQSTRSQAHHSKKKKVQRGEAPCHSRGNAKAPHGDECSPGEEGKWKVENVRGLHQP